MEAKQEKTVSETIIEFLEAYFGKWCFGGTIEDHVRSKLGSKASHAARVCRGLCEDGILDRRTVQIDGKGPHVVQYQLVPIAVRNERRKFGKGTSLLF